MPSPRPRIYSALLAKELRDFLRSSAFWGMMLILCLLVGYSFIQAVALYAEASRSAPLGSDLARSLSALDGILVPTFGAYYLVLTLLFPFVAIRAIGAERQSGSIKLLLQLPVSPAEVVAIKAFGMMVCWALALVPWFCAAAAWIMIGGYVAWLETLNLLLGYSLYAFAVLGISLLASVLADSVSTAALIALAVILSSWVLDFSGGSFASISLTAALRPFERGLFLLSSGARLTVAGLGAMALAAVLIPAENLWRKLRAAALTLLLVVLAGAIASRVRCSRDVSEDRRNSFGPASESALEEIEKPLKITVHLSLEDSRFQDLERNILGKLRRAVARLTIVVDTSRDYGWIIYDYDGKEDRSTSNSEEEILPIIFKLAGRTAPAGSVSGTLGHPLTRDAGKSWILFYLVLPGLLALGAIWSRRAGEIEGMGGNGT